MSLAQGFSRWMDRVLDADDRYICASCDDRFPGYTEASAHVVAFHPELAGALANEVVDRPGSCDSSSGRTQGASRPYLPAWG